MNENLKIEWLKNCLSKEAFDYIFSSEEEVKKWIERCNWHVKRCAELRKELDELKSNPPLKFEDLKRMVGSPVWDNQDKKWLLIESAYKPSVIGVPISQNAFCIKMVDVKKTLN